MTILPNDDNSRAIQCANFGFGYNLTEGSTTDNLNTLVRFKNTGSTNAVIRYDNSVGDGVVLSPGETEYFFVKGIIKVVSGTLNIMY